MDQHKPGYDAGVSEVIGVIFLVSLIVLAFGIVSLVLTSQTHKEQIPEINTVISNLTNSTTGQNLVYITHTGGNYLQTGQYLIFINHIDRTSNITTISGDTNNSEWNAGETLVINAGSETPYLVQIYYKGATTTELLVEYSLSSTLPVPTQTTAPPGYCIITSSVSGNGGSINPLGTLYVPYGGSQGYSIINDMGYHISGVFVNGVPRGAITTYTFPNVTSNQQISVTFAINTYQINTSSGPNGAVTPAGTNTVNYGDTPTYTITPNPGYHVADVLVNGVSVGAVTTYTFPFVAANQTISATFAINSALSITQLNPSSATAGSPGITLTVTGTGYLSSSTVYWNGVSRATTYVSPTQLTATIHSSDIVSAGTVPVTVANPGGATSNTASFTINGPIITQLNPSSAIAGSPGITLTVTGTGYLSSSTVYWNGVSRTTTYVSPTQLTAAIPSSDITSAGTASVTVVNPGGATSNTASFTINSQSSGNPIIFTKSAVGYLMGGSYIQFKTSTGNSYITVNGVTYNLKNNQVIRLVIKNNQNSGDADIQRETVTRFNFIVDLYLDNMDAPINSGLVNSLYIEKYDTYSSTLAFHMPSISASTNLVVNGVTIIPWYPYDSSIVDISNIGVPTTGPVRIDLNSNQDYIYCAGNYVVTPA